MTLDELLKHLFGHIVGDDIAKDLEAFQVMKRTFRNEKPRKRGTKLSEIGTVRYELLEPLQPQSEIVAEEEPESVDEGISDEELSESEQCAFCNKQIYKDTDVDVELLVEGYDLGEESSVSVCLEGANRSIPAYVASGTDAESKKEYVGFITCSRKCSLDLRTLLQYEMDVGKITLEYYNSNTEETDSGNVSIE